MRPPTLTRNFLVVTGIHLGLFGVVFLSALLYACAHVPLPDTPVELILAIPAHEQGTPQPEATVRKDPKPPEPEVSPDPSPQPPPPDDEAIAEVKPVPPVAKHDDPKPPVRPRIDISRDRRILKVLDLPPATTIRKVNITPEELRRAIGLGAVTGPRATLPDDQVPIALTSGRHFGPGNPVTARQMYMDQIKQIMYRAWTQPATTGIHGLVAMVQITLRSDGTLTGSILTKASGSPLMDESVIQAVRSVARLPGIPADFLASNPQITVAFELTDR